MPAFETPDPLSVTLEFDVGTARITAGHRTDTVVEVLPGDSTTEADVQAARQTKVSCSGGRLVVKGPKKRSLFGKAGAVDVTIELPAGSEVQAVSKMADFTCEGPLGDCRLRTGLGDLQVGEAATVDLRTGHGDIRVDRVTGNAELAGAGRVEVGSVAGTLTVRNGNGETRIDEAGGELRANSSNGSIEIGTAHAGVVAKSANGGIRIDRATRGTLVLQTATTDIEVGIAESTAAWLDVHTQYGRVRNSLSAAEGPEATDATVEVRARAGVGDIVIHRA